MDRTPRPGGQGAIRKLVAHINVGPEEEGGAQSLLNELQRQSGGYHEICDDRTWVIAANPDQVVWGASGMNDDGYHICLIGTIQTADQWNDAYSNGELNVAASRFAQRCHDFGIPPIHLSDVAVADRGLKGICDHWAVNRAIVLPAVARGDHSMGPGDHTDVGAAFPWDKFMGLVAHYYDPAAFPTPPPTPKVVEMFACEVNGNATASFIGAQYDPATKTITAIGGAAVVPSPADMLANPHPTKFVYRTKDDPTDGVARFTVVLTDNDKYTYRVKH